MEKSEIEAIASRGGTARAKSLTKEERSEIARWAVEKRWTKEGKRPLLRATHGSEDHPLRIGGIEIPCYVLEDGTRVISQRGIQHGISMTISGGSQQMVRFIANLNVCAEKKVDLTARIMNPIRFQPKRGGAAGHGYEATLLADLCDAVLEARATSGNIRSTTQERIAKQCEVLVRGFAAVGIIALIDEATGYQEDRDRQALSKILEAFIAKELRRWVQTFPVDYYKELYRLRGLAYPPTGGNKMPRYFGRLTNEIVYERLAPGVLEELRKTSPRDNKGRLKHHYHRRLTDDVGHPKLLQHLGAVVACMKLSKDGDYDGFIKVLDKHYPKQTPLPLFEHEFA